MSQLISLYMVGLTGGEKKKMINVILLFRFRLADTLQYMGAEAINRG